jgi:hypothetical protein
MNERSGQTRTGCRKALGLGFVAAAMASALACSSGSGGGGGESGGRLDSGSGSSSGSTSSSGSSGSGSSSSSSGSSSGSGGGASSSSGGVEPGNSVTGSAGGVSLTANGAVAINAPDDGTGTLSIILANVSLDGVCTSAQAGTPTQPASMTWLNLEAFDIGSKTVSTGTYSWNNGPGTGDANLYQSSSTCETTAGDSAYKGTIKVTAISSSTVSGTFELTFEDGTMSGSFSAPICAGIGYTGDAGAATCQ